MAYGILGGTFDPIHLGHVQLALAAADELALERVLLLPDKDPPHKAPTTAAFHRLRMAEVAARADSRLEACDMELKRPGRTYTVDTLEEMKQLFPGQSAIYIIGSDTLLQFHTWKTPGQVARLCEMAVAARDGDEEALILAAQKEMEERFGLKSRLLKARVPPLSSAHIRKLFLKGLGAEGLVPKGVLDYIVEHHLYRGERRNV